MIRDIKFSFIMAGLVDEVIRKVSGANVVDHAICKGVAIAARIMDVCLRENCFRRSFCSSGFLDDILVPRKFGQSRLTFDVGVIKNMQWACENPRF